jgi:hypothetical protein
MRIRTLWKTWDDDDLELLFALDDETTATNWQAWEDGCKAARVRYGIGEVDTREAIIHVPHGPIAALFEVPEIQGTVEP